MNANEQKIINLLKMQTALQRELKPKLDEFERIVNEIELLVAASEKRQPLRKMVEVKVRVMNNFARE
jgi:hypothetical protein